MQPYGAPLRRGTCIAALRFGSVAVHCQFCRRDVGSLESRVGHIRFWPCAGGTRPRLRLRPVSVAPSSEQQNSLAAFSLATDRLLSGSDQLGVSQGAPPVSRGKSAKHMQLRLHRQ